CGPFSSCWSRAAHPLLAPFRATRARPCCGQGKCYTLAYTLDTGSPASCPAIDPYLGAPGEVDYAMYRSPSDKCKTMWTDQCGVTDDCTEPDGTREEASIAFNID